jgi:hypothetical protein
MDSNTKKYLMIGGVTVVVALLGFIAYKHFTKPELDENSSAPQPSPAMIKTEQEKQVATEDSTSKTAPTTRPLVNIIRSN